MQTPLKVDFESLQPSTPLTEEIRKELVRLERLIPRVIGCHVVVREPHRHQQSGRQFEIHVRVTVPGGEFVVSHNPPKSGYDDPYRAVRNAFNRVRRQYREFVRKRRFVRRAVNGETS